MSGLTLSATYLRKSGTLFAEWLTASTLAEILTLDIVTCVAVGVVVIDRLLQ